jgi:deoxyhypusine monooxygenase
VRHEAAESLGAIADGKTMALLKDFTKDEEPIVADSCVVALDMLEFELSGAFQYADVGTNKETEVAA